MTVIHFFADYQHLTTYINQSVLNSSTIKLDSSNVQHYVELYALSPSYIEEVTSQPPYYLFLGSKTSYRKFVHPYLPNVLYKKMYNVFKNNNVIKEATGSIVLISPNLITQQVFDQIAVTSDLDNLKILNQVMDTFSNATADNQYYIDYIKSLEQKHSDLQKECEELRQQVSNNKLITWY